MEERRGAGATATEVTGSSLATGAEQSRAPALQALYDRHRALDLLVRELRRSLDLPVRTPEAGFSRPKLSSEIEASYRASNKFSFYGSVAYTDAEYVKFTNAPLPLEETGKTQNNVQVAFKDISDGRLPGISKWAYSTGGEFNTPSIFLGNASKFFIAADLFYRSGFSSSPSPSAYLNIGGYTLVNSRVGFKATKGLSAFVWVRNLFNENYHEQLLPAGGNAGHYASVLGDPRTYGVTLRYVVQ